MLATITKAELQAYVEKLLFQPNRANRLDMHWNSQPHIKLEAEGGEETKASEEVKTEDAAAASEEVKTEDASKAEGAAAADSTPDPVPTYETEMKHHSVNHFKKSMGLFVDNFKLAYASTNFSL